MMRIESQVFLRDDLENILRALAQTSPSGEYGDGFRAALVAVGTAVGMRPTAQMQEHKPQLTGWENIGVISKAGFK